MYLWYRNTSNLFTRNAVKYNCWREPFSFFKRSFVPVGHTFLMVLLTVLTLNFITRLILDSQTSFRDAFLEQMFKEVSPILEDSIKPKIVAELLLL